MKIQYDKEPILLLVLTRILFIGMVGAYLLLNILLSFNQIFTKKTIYFLLGSLAWYWKGLMYIVQCKEVLKNTNETIKCKSSKAMRRM